jgi:hypothetical protein
MRERRIRHRLDFLDVEDTQVGVPLMESEQAIMIGNLSTSAASGLGWRG